VLDMALELERVLLCVSVVEKVLGTLGRGEVGVGVGVGVGRRAFCFLPHFGQWGEEDGLLPGPPPVLVVLEEEDRFARRGW
jgi:hypothetical protein